MMTFHAASGELIDIYPFGEVVPQAYIVKGQTNGAALLHTLRDDIAHRQRGDKM